MKTHELSRLSLNQITTKQWSVGEAVDGCVRAGLGSIGLWRQPVAETGITVAAQMVRDTGLRVSSLCRGGFVTAEGNRAQEAFDDNLRAIDEAATLGTDTLIMVVGGLPEGSRDLASARERVRDVIGRLAPIAGQHRVRLGLEPLHPMYCADRSVLSTLGQALDIAEAFPLGQVGVVIDTFHVWWDPQIWEVIGRVDAARIAGFHVSDFMVPLPSDILLGRTMMGDGVIDLPAFYRAVHDAGYEGSIEVEIMNADIWAADPDDVLARMKRRYLDIVAYSFDDHSRRPFSDDPHVSHAAYGDTLWR